MGKINSWVLCPAWYGHCHITIRDMAMALGTSTFHFSRLTGLPTSAACWFFKAVALSILSAKYSLGLPIPFQADAAPYPGHCDLLHVLNVLVNHASLASLIAHGTFSALCFLYSFYKLATSHQRKLLVPHYKLWDRWKPGSPRIILPLLPLITQSVTWLEVSAWLIMNIVLKLWGTPIHQWIWLLTRHSITFILVIVIVYICRGQTNPRQRSEHIRPWISPIGVFNSLEVLWQDILHFLPMISLSQRKRISPTKTSYWLLMLGWDVFTTNGEALWDHCPLS